ncbi:catechol 2,3-dioxygenase-like lactoylglutathione lyase family enzyme [Streptomyces phaeoluteigriseus]
MAIQRMDNVGIVVEDMDAAIAFFVELGMELEGRGEVEGLFADQCTGLDGVRCDIAMVRTPDGHSRLELAKYRSPAAISGGPRNQPAQHRGHAPRHVRRRRHRGHRCPSAPSRR